MTNTHISAIARFIRKRFAMVYILRPRTIIKQTNTLPMIPRSAKNPLNANIMVMIIGGIETDP